MKKICVLFSSIIIFSTLVSADEPDTIVVQKAFITGIELTGPVIGFINPDNVNYEAYISYRKSFKYYLVASIAYSNYHFEQYNYNYDNNGIAISLGTDINLLKPKMRTGNNFVGIGIRYGLSVFTQETPWLKYDNYWGSSEAQLDPKTATGHFIQLSGGVKAELFKNILIGWTVKVNLLMFHTAGKDNRPVYIPGMGSSDKTIGQGVAFHIAWMIPTGKN